MRVGRGRNASGQGHFEGGLWLGMGRSAKKSQYQLILRHQKFRVKDSLSQRLKMTKEGEYEDNAPQTGLSKIEQVQ